MAWAVDLEVQITDVGRSLYIGSFCPAMTSLSRYLEEVAFSISISSSVFIFLWLFSRCTINIQPWYMYARECVTLKYMNMMFVGMLLNYFNEIT